MTKLLLLAGLLVVFCCSSFALPCLPGTLQDYYNLGSTGCDLGSVLVTDFSAATGLPGATVIDPALILVSPAATLFNETLLFTLDSTASAGELFQSFFHFSASAALLQRASITLNSATATGDGLVLGILDVCPDGFFDPGAPVGCPTSPATAIAFAIDGNQQLTDFRDFPATSFFDVFVDLSVDGGVGGSGALESASIGISSIPEPSAPLLVLAGLAVTGIFRTRSHNR